MKYVTILIVSFLTMVGNSQVIDSTTLDNYSITKLIIGNELGKVNRDYVTKYRNELKVCVDVNKINGDVIKSYKMLIKSLLRNDSIVKEIYSVEAGKSKNYKYLYDNCRESESDINKKLKRFTVIKNNYKYGMFTFIITTLVLFILQIL